MLQSSKVELTWRSGVSRAGVKLGATFLMPDASRRVEFTTKLGVCFPMNLVSKIHYAATDGRNL